jgi:hypothetical protein
MEAQKLKEVGPPLRNPLNLGKPTSPQKKRFKDLEPTFKIIIK